MPETFIITDNRSIGEAALIPQGGFAVQPSPSDRSRMEGILNNRDMAEERLAEVMEGIDIQITGQSSPAVLAGESIVAAVSGQAGSYLAKTESLWNTIGKNINEQVISPATRVPAQLVKAQLNPVTQPWERELYTSLPQGEAYRVATTLWKTSGLTNTDLSAQAAMAAMSNGASCAPGDTCFDPRPVAQTNYAVPQPPVPDQNQCDKTTLPPCSATGPGGYCRGTDGIVNVYGEVPDIIGLASADRPPTEAEIKNARGLWATGLHWDENSRSWQALGIHSNPPACIKIAPPPPTNSFLGEPCKSYDEFFTTLPPLPPGKKWCIGINSFLGGCVVYEALLVGANDECQEGYREFIVPYDYVPTAPPPQCVIPLGNGFSIGPDDLFCPTVSPSITNNTTNNYTTNNTLIGDPLELSNPDDETEPAVPPLQPPPPPPEPTFDNACLPYDDPRSICNVLGILSGDIVVSDGKVSPGATGAGAGGITTWLYQGFKEVYTDIKNLYKDAPGSVNEGVIADIDMGVKIATAMMLKKPCKDATGSGIATGIASRIGAGEFIGSKLHIPMDYLNQDLVYAMQYALPQYIPDQGSIDSLMLSGKITNSEWRCYTKANGNLPNLHGMVANLKRERIGINDCIKLFKAGVLSPGEFNERMQENGIVDDRDFGLIVQNYVNYPSFGEIITFMVRDAFDEEAVAENDLDNEFDEKYTDLAKQYGDVAGLTEQVAKLHWRSHWSYPSNTALYEMLHRLRPGRNPDGLVVTEEDAAKLLGINDVAPGWREKLLAVSYLVPTRTDVKRGYNIGSLERDEVKEALLDTGLDDAGADFTLAIYDEEKNIYDQVQAKKYSIWTPKTILGAIAAGTMSEQQGRLELERLKVNEDYVEGALASAKVKATTLKNAECMKSIRSRYMVGALTFLQAQQELFQLTNEPNVANTVAEGWECKFKAKSKEIPAAKNVEWFRLGIITEGEFSRRLHNLGYSDQNTGEYLQEVMAKQAENLKKQQIAANKENEARARRDAKEQAAAQKARRKAVADALKAQESAKKGTKRTS